MHSAEVHSRCCNGHSSFACTALKTRPLPPYQRAPSLSHPPDHPPPLRCTSTLPSRHPPDHPPHTSLHEPPGVLAATTAGELAATTAGELAAIAMTANANAKATHADDAQRRLVGVSMSKSRMRSPGRHPHVCVKVSKCWPRPGPPVSNLPKKGRCLCQCFSPDVACQNLDPRSGPSVSNLQKKGRRLCQILGRPAACVKL